MRFFFFSMLFQWNGETEISKIRERGRETRKKPIEAFPWYFNCHMVPSVRCLSTCMKSLSNNRRLCPYCLCTYFIKWMHLIEDTIDERHKKRFNLRAIHIIYTLRSYNTIDLISLFFFFHWFVTVFCFSVLSDIRFFFAGFNHL